MDEVARQIKQVVYEELEKSGYHPAQLVLFGSRARGEADEQSDWDVLVVTQEPVDIAQKRQIILSIKRRLAALHIPNDILLCSSQDVTRYRHDVGRVYYYALREGVPL